MVVSSARAETWAPQTWSALVWGTSIPERNYGCDLEHGQCLSFAPLTKVDPTVKIWGGGYHSNFGVDIFSSILDHPGLAVWATEQKPQEMGQCTRVVVILEQCR